MDLVRFEQVSLTVEGRQLLQDVSFAMSKGEHVGVIGPSGAGKSTFLNLLLGFLSPSEGNVSLFGENLAKVSVSELEDLRMDMGMLF